MTGSPAIVTAAAIRLRAGPQAILTSVVLPRSRRADDGDELAFLERQVDVVQHAARAEALR